ncbi:MAG: TIR domain-containing protein [Bacteroidetes bacterium]|nr:TIR domain-containing protein [Bacteroidota bacterium]
MGTTSHRVFISYHHTDGDEYYRNHFEALFENHHEIIVNKSVKIGDIDTSLKTETIRQKIRDEYIADATVTIVLIGKYTWQRKHVDWEIASSIRDTMYNPRNGLLGIFLPTYPITLDTQGSPVISKYTIPPRLYDNFECGYAKLYRWSDDPVFVQKWIHKAFLDRKTILPDNSRDSFTNNRSGEQWN